MVYAASFIVVREAILLCYVNSNTLHTKVYECTTFLLQRRKRRYALGRGSNKKELHGLGGLGFFTRIMMVACVMEPRKNR